jgi:ABC-type multidrug transport system fused ATPase/permease subunit
MKLRFVKELWFYLPSKRRKHFFFLIFLIFFGALTEFISIGLLIPLIAAISNPDIIFANKYSKYFVELIGVSNKNNFLVISFIVFALAAIFTGFVRVLLIKYTASLSYQIGSDLNLSVYKRILSQTFEEQAGEDKSLLINLIITKTKLVVTGLIYPAITALSSITIASVILCLLIFINPLITILTAFVILLVYSTITFIFRLGMNNRSKLIAKNSSRIVLFLQESLGSIRDIILDNAHSNFYKKFSDIDIPLQKSEGEIIVIGQCPKYLIESFGMVLLAFIALILIKFSHDLNEVLITMAVIALSAQRLLPLAQNIYFSFSSIRSVSESLYDVLEVLKKPIHSFPNSHEMQNLSFNKSIILKNISYAYPKERNAVFKGITLRINQGDRIGIIGDSGCGKSTFLDLLMGLIQPTSGSIYVDGIKLTKYNLQKWQKNISHVPQNIFLINESIKNNIIFLSEQDHINLDLLDKVCNIAQLKSFVGDSLNGINKIVGDRGEKLSGGQRQRIGLARAMYKNPTVFILDEATSALDGKTEQKIIQAIHNSFKQSTIIMVTHRMSTLKHCNKVFKLEGKKIVTIRTETKKNDLKKFK